MRSGIHPEYHEITIETTNGVTYQTRSTWGDAGDKMKLEIDPDTHPAWTGGQQKVLERGQVARFGRRYQGKSFSASVKPAAPEVQAQPKKPTAPKKEATKKPETKPADKVENKTAPKPDDKAESKMNNDVGNKADNQAEAKTENKEEVKS